MTEQPYFADAETVAAVQIGLDQIARGEIVSWEQSNAELQKFMAECDILTAQTLPA